LERELTRRTREGFLQLRENFKIIAAIRVETALDDRVRKNPRRSGIYGPGYVENWYVNVYGDVLVTSGAD
jgi:hypothetical protein